MKVMASLGFWEVVAEDLRASKLLKLSERNTKLTVVRKVLWSLLFHPSFTCVFFYRVNRLLYERRLPMRNFLSARRIYWFGNEISYYASIGPGLRLVHISSIVVGADAVIGARCTILNDVTIGSKNRSDPKMPTIGDDVYVGSGARILGNIRVGNNVTIGALTLCSKDIADNNIVYGISPNQVVKPIDILPS